MLINMYYIFILSFYKKKYTNIIKYQLLYKNILNVVYNIKHIILTHNNHISLFSIFAFFYDF